MKLLVAIHDVTPALARETLDLWRLCTDRGFQPALHVVPNWHGRWPLEQDRAFVRWLHQCAESGAEIFLHGERHDEIGLQRGWRDELRAFGRTAGEAEFLTLTEMHARERIDRGIRRLRALGFDPVGFCAPAWLARAECYRVVADVGLHVAEDDRVVWLCKPSIAVKVPVIRWSGRSSWRAWASAFVADARWTMRDWWEPMRIALHPSDLHHPATARSVEVALDRWLTVRRPFPYAAL